MRSLLLEALVWYGGAAAFLFLYVQRYAAPTQAALPHFDLLTTAVAGLACVRLAVWRWIPGARAPRWICATLIASLLILLVGYYALVLAGLESWGRVISWNLIRAYTGQAMELSAALGVSPAQTRAAVATGLAVFVLLTIVFAARSDWASALARGRLRRVMPSIVVLGMAIIMVRFYSFAAAPPAHTGEPVSLTLFPAPAFELQRNRTGESPGQNMAEEAARKAYVANPAFKRRNVIVIVGDALRPDHMGIYGYSRQTTPHIERWSRRAVLRRSDSMRAACAESACGLVAMATSKYVHQISHRAFSMPEVLRRHGYSVHMILGGDHTNFYGLRDAYGAVDSYFDGSLASRYYTNDDELVVERAAGLPDWDDKPVMIQFHLMATHELGKRHAEALKFEPSTNYALMVLRRGSSASVDQRTTNYYDNGVVQFDLIVGRLLELLERKRYLDEALVVITADHGEMLGEHGRLGHGALHEQVLRIPFLMLSFGYQPSEPIASSSVASQIDIAPTILAELEIPPPSTWAGHPLQRRSNREVVHFQEETRIGLFDLRQAGPLYKYWTDIRSGEEVAYDLAEDPAESRNRLERVPRELLRDWRLRISAIAVPIAQ